RPQEAGAYRWRADFRGERLAGRLDWMRSPGQRNRLTADLARLRLPEPGQWQSVDVPGSEGGGALPALDVLLTADRIALGERELEDTRIQAQSFPERLLLHGVQTRLGKSDLRLQGDWLAERGRTRLRLDLATRDFGRWLRDVGVYPSMKGGEGSLGGTLSWPGRPRDFAMGALDGSLRLNMVEGEIEEFYFLSKALATLNVLDWPRQVLRGMRDVGSSGLVYRELRGRTRIRDGEAVLKDWVMESAPLRMTVEGGISLGRRRYDLILHLAPLQTIDQIVSAVPLVGYLLTGRERTLTALSYKVVGPWAEPEVSGLGEGDGEPGGVEGFFRRVKEMQWKDLLPWR
ncbi:MAG TPA: AsmA-like C-terminal region-containing protein, partial [Gammaproteobacteria bacterium]|nr:AsmA-like C-terminal region-containing protein [Gammaproteobacteria bacterium]